MDDYEENIRLRAYEIWERQGRAGDPEDHWRQAEREVKAEKEAHGTPQGRSDATVEEVPPVDAVEALEAASDSPAKGKRSSRSSQS